ncbi:MAG: hypothetical protein HYZ74_04545 [Elusimicrobia bacterium]|nr:hypothetical protein [Elusimicrobiota bacterium]
MSEFRKLWDDFAAENKGTDTEENEALGTFMATLLSFSWVVLADREALKAGKLQPFLIDREGTPTALMFESKACCPEFTQLGAQLVTARGDQFADALSWSENACLAIGLDDGSTLPLSGVMIRLLKRLVEQTEQDNPGLLKTAPAAGVVKTKAQETSGALKECLCRNMEVAAAFLHEPGDGKPPRLVLRMHKGQEKAFEYAARDLRRVVEEGGVGFEIAAEDPAQPAPGRQFYKA